MTLRISFVASMLGLWIFCASARAQTATWTNAANGNFSAAANWTGGVPGVGSIAVFNATPTPYSVSFSSSPTNSVLRVQNGNVTFLLGGQTYTMNGGALIGDVPLQLGQLSLSTGTLASAGGTVGGPGNGLVSIGAAAAWNSSGPLNFGVNGNATLNINAGGRLSNTQSSIASGAGVSGIVTVSGASATWVNSTLMSVGGAGNATLIISNGGSVAATSALNNVASSASGSGNVLVSGSGSAWNISGDLSVGGSSSAAGGAGSVTLSQGGALSLTGNGRLRLWPGAVVTIDTGILSLASIEDRGGAINFAAGTVNFPAGTTLDSASIQTLLGPSHGLAPGRTLNVAGAATLGTSLSLDGGVFSVGSLTLGAPLVLNSGTLTIGSPLVVGVGGPFGDTLTLGSSLAVNATNGASVSPGGLLNLAGGRLTSGTGTITNDGEILLDGPTSLLSANVTNNQLLSGDGRIAGRITNAAPGEIRVSTAQRLNVTGTGGDNSNLGQINLFGGVLELTSLLLNSPGARITGRGTIIAHGGLALDGATLALSGQTSDVFGAVINESGAKIIITGGSTSTFVDAVTNAAGSEFRVSTASTAVFLSNVSGLGQFTGAGIKDFEGSAAAGPLATSGSSIVGPDAALTARHVRENSLQVDGIATIEPDGTDGGTSRLNELIIAGSPDAWSGKLDLNDNDLIIDYTGASPLGAVQNQITSGFNHGAWNGTGITATLAGNGKALGYADNLSLGLTQFSGQSVDATSVLIKFTFPGDANLDGQVDVTDLGALATNWQTNSAWTGGDFNYDGFVDVTDLGMLATNWQAGVGSPLAPSRLDEALAAAGLSAVPEPSATLLLLLATALRSRRRFSS